ncbi:MAG: hypothetical protein FWC91_13335 [Defluviitaleaceae bacterium]|nr:hypothetical protein [Defluviitaleaceae bacterium]
MVQIAQEHKRIQMEDGYDLYPDKCVLLGYTEEYENIYGIKSGIVLAVGESTDSDAIWSLYEDYLLSGKHGSLLVIYFGAVEASGVYI